VGRVISVFGWVAGELLLEWRRRRRLRALVARPVPVRIEENVMRKVEVKLVVEFADETTLEGRVEALRQMRAAALRHGAREIDITPAVREALRLPAVRS
jgi:hypothetical protein